MTRVQLLTWAWALGGAIALAALVVEAQLSALGAIAGAAYLVVSSTLLSVGLRRRGSTLFGAANAVTATRSVLIGLVTAVVVSSLTGSVPMLLVFSLAIPALLLDGVDGFVARRTHSESELGARFDMEADAFLILVLSVYDVRFVGPCVLAIGLMRYAFVVASWALPWMRSRLPFRYWRKVVAASCGIVLAVVASGLVVAPWSLVLTLLALGLLIESFGRDVIWLVRRRPRTNLVTD